LGLACLHHQLRLGLQGCLRQFTRHAGQRLVQHCCRRLRGRWGDPGCCGLCWCR
jgi:hypothetical protein